MYVVSLWEATRKGMAIQNLDKDQIMKMPNDKNVEV